MCRVVDLEQPRAMWETTWDDEERDALVGNLAAHMGNIKNKDIANRQCTLSSQSLSLMHPLLTKSLCISGNIRCCEPGLLRCTFDNIP